MTLKKTSFAYELALNARLSASWAGETLARVPEPWRARAEGGYRARLAALPEAVRRGVAPQNDADFWLDALAKKSWALRVPLGLSDADLIARAEECARMAWALAESAPGHFLTAAQLRARLARFVGSFGIKPPGCEADGPAISRMTSPIWWRRALRVSQARELESVGIGLGYVHKHAEIYATDATVERRQQQRRRNAAALENTQAINVDTGQEYTLAQLAALSVANPAIRRGELMVRIRGFESVAKKLGHVAEFVTLTCPSRFHRMRKAGPRVEENPKHDGSSPRDAQAYLVALWARLRAKLARMGLRVYGFRIAEPHHDATPHWHLLLFMPEFLRAGVRTVARFRAVFRRYGLKDSPEEPGAKKYRCKFEAINWTRGTAAGYVAKYVSKNIDGGGYQVQGDIEGGDSQAITPSHRVEAWASTWGIRQFQQIGGPPVGVWRELRRMDAVTAPGAETLEAARLAAGEKDGFKPDWGAFVEAMGGPTVERRALPLRVAYDDEARLTQYGDLSAPRPVGVRFYGLESIGLGVRLVQMVAESRRYQWEIKRGVYGKGANVFEQRGKAARIQGAKKAQGCANSVAFGFGFGGKVVRGNGDTEIKVVLGRAQRGPRTRVNNCTRTFSVRAVKGGPARVEFSKIERETLESWERWRKNAVEDSGGFSGSENPAGTRKAGAESRGAGGGWFSP